MKNVTIKLVRNDSDATSFTFLNEHTSDVLLEATLANLNDEFTIEIPDDCATFKIVHNGTSDEFDFVSSSMGE